MLAFVSAIALSVLVTLSLLPRSPINLPNRIGDNRTSIFTYLNRERAEIVLPAPSGPVWNSGERNPPLSVLDAISVAAKKRREIHPDEKKWKWALDKTELLPWDADGGYWFWKLTFGKQHQPSEDDLMMPGHSGPPSELVLVVLMDGAVIQPEYVDE